MHLTCLKITNFLSGRKFVSFGFNKYYISIISDEFALNYVKTLVIPVALEKFRAVEDRDKHNGKNAFLIHLSV